jgi:hypothetical protein
VLGHRGEAGLHVPRAGTDDRGQPVSPPDSGCPAEPPEHAVHGLAHGHHSPLWQGPTLTPDLALVVARAASRRVAKAYIPTYQGQSESPPGW